VLAGDAAAPKRLSVAQAEHIVNQAPLKEISPDDVFEKLHCQVFKVTEGHDMFATFVVRDGQARPLGQSFGGSGVMSMCVTELKDSGPVLVYTYSWGSGLHRSHVAVCRINGEKFEDAVVPFAMRNVDMRVKKGEDGKVLVYVGETLLGPVEITQNEGKLEADVKLVEPLPEDMKKNIWRQNASK
jgi:hypothetical protein